MAREGEDAAGFLCGIRRLSVRGKPRVLVAALAMLTLGPALGGARRLSYHEAIVAQGAREMLADGADWRIPTVGGLPWLEKPPLAHWLVAGAGWCWGMVDEWVARFPSAIAAMALCLVVWAVVRPRWGARLALLAGLVQATTAWTVARGRLADADMLLASLVSGVILAFDRMRQANASGQIAKGWRWVFFGLLGATSLAKGLGFGAGLAGVAILATVVWDRDWRLFRSLVWLPGWLMAIGLTMAWPLSVVVEHPDAAFIWLAHVTDRLGDASGLAGRFAGEPTWRFLLAPLGLVLPWTPLALVALRRSIRVAYRPAGRFGADRLLLAWAFVPVALLACTSVKNDHYLIHGLAPWSVWSARGLMRLGVRLRVGRGWTSTRLAMAGSFWFIGLGLAYGAGFALLGPRLDDRGREWSWYGSLRPHLAGGEPLVLLYDWDGPDPWDRLPYPTPSGPVPPDLAVRLFYMETPAASPPRFATSGGQPDLALVEPGAPSPPFLVLGRPRDLSSLKRLGGVEVLSEGPAHRWDRHYVLVRIHSSRAIR